MRDTCMLQVDVVMGQQMLALQFEVDIGMMVWNRQVELVDDDDKMKQKESVLDMMWKGQTAISSHHCA